MQRDPSCFALCCTLTVSGWTKPGSIRETEKYSSTDRTTSSRKTSGSSSSPRSSHRRSSALTQHTETFLSPTTADERLKRNRGQSETWVPIDFFFCISRLKLQHIKRSQTTAYKALEANTRLIGFLVSKRDDTFCEQINFILPVSCKKSDSVTAQVSRVCVARTHTPLVNSFRPIPPPYISTDA